QAHIKYRLYGPGPVDLLKALTEHRIDAAVFNGPIMSYYAKTSFANKITILRFPLRQDFMAFPMHMGTPLRKPINRALLKIVGSPGWPQVLNRYLNGD